MKSITLSIITALLFFSTISFSMQQQTLVQPSAEERKKNQLQALRIMRMRFIHLLQDKFKEMEEKINEGNPLNYDFHPIDETRYQKNFATETNTRNQVFSEQQKAGSALFKAESETDTLLRGTEHDLSTPVVDHLVDEMDKKREAVFMKHLEFMGVLAQQHADWEQHLRLLIPHSGLSFLG